MRSKQLESAYATTWELDRSWWWTGWRRHHWPADIVRPGQKIYVFNKDSRTLTALVQITYGGSFSFSSKTEFKQGVKRLIGEEPDADSPHWRRIPSSRDSVGVAAEGRVVKRVSIPFRVRFPQIGFMRLRKDGNTVASQETTYGDAADLYVEGDRRLWEHVRTERNPRLRIRAMTLWRRERGRLRCDVCRFDFEHVYGTLGVDFIEMHHTKPLARASGERKASPRELVPLCSNCHRMVHRHRDDTLTTTELKRILRRSRR